MWEVWTGLALVVAAGVLSAAAHTQLGAHAGTFHLADRRLQTSGVFGLSRHPMYLSYNMQVGLRWVVFIHTASSVLSVLTGLSVLNVPVVC